MLSAIANSFSRKKMLIDNVSEEKGREAGVTLTFVCQECDKHFEMIPQSERDKVKYVTIDMWDHFKMFR